MDVNEHERLSNITLRHKKEHNKGTSLLLMLCISSHMSVFNIGARVAQWVRSLDLTAHTSLSPIWREFAPSFVNYKKGCTRLAAASDKAYQLLAQGRWFSPDTPAFSTTKTGRHDIAEILLKVALNTKKIQIQINSTFEQSVKHMPSLPFSFLCSVLYHFFSFFFWPSCRLS
jgi:hypothetical protein